MHHKFPNLQIAVIFGIIFLSMLEYHAAYAEASTGIIEPLYLKAFSNATFNWQPVVDAKAAHPQVPFFAIVNPSDGPGKPAPVCAYQVNLPGNLTLDYRTGIQRLDNAGIIVLGYVDTINDTTNKQKSYGQVLRELDTWSECYSGMQGIYLDDMRTWPFTAGNLTYYQNLTNYIHDTLKLKYSFGNPGTDTDPRFFDTIDAINIFENGALPQDSALLGANNWHIAHDKSHFMFIAFNQTALPNSAWMRETSSYVKYMFLTSAPGPNPWNSIPSYLDNETASLDAPSILIKVSIVGQNGSKVSGPLVGISSGINQTYNLTRTGNATFDYNATMGSEYQISAQQCYGNWMFDHWQIVAPPKFIDEKYVPWGFGFLYADPHISSDSSMHLLPTTSVNLTAGYSNATDCNSTWSNPQSFHTIDIWDHIG